MEQGVASKLKKLKGKSMRELKDRAGQQLSKYSERLLRMSVGEMTDQAFLRRVKRGERATTARETALRVVERIQSATRASDNPRFFPSLSYRAEISSVMEQRFGSEREAIIDRAERAIKGRFDLLGFSDLDFGAAPDWLLEPVSGRRAPLRHWSSIDYLNHTIAGDKKVTWELNRHQHFVTLGQAYWMTGDERYAEAFISQATSWMDQNQPKLGINWASSLELAFRSISWLWALHLFAGSATLRPAFVLRLLKHLVAHAEHIYSYLSRYFSPNTHLTGEALGLFYIGTAIGEFQQAEVWRKLGLEILIEESSRQVRSDGVYFEQATYYHRYTADFYIHLMVLARASRLSLPPDVEDRLARLLNFLMWITRPDGSSPLIGDDDGGRLLRLGERRLDDFRDTLATGAALFGRGDWKHAANAGAVETLWLLGPEGIARYDELTSERPRELSHVFDASGHVVMRDGWSADSSCAVIDCGPHGALSYGHAHSDALSFEFVASGKTWIVDPGTFTYTGDSALRNSFRTTAAHNTVLVDGKSQSVPAGPFSWHDVAGTSLDDFILGEGFDYFEGTHYGYERLADPVRHTRAVICPKKTEDNPAADGLPSYLIVNDLLKAAGRHRYELRFHLAPGCHAFASDNSILVTEPGGGRLKIIAFGQSNPRARIIDGWVSQAYGQRESAPVAIFEARAEGAQHFTTFIVPAPANSSIKVEEQRLGQTGARCFEVASAGTRDLLLLGEQSEAIKWGPMSAEAMIAWARFEGDWLARAFLVRGQRLETSDGFAFRSDSPVRHCAIRRTRDCVEGSVAGGDAFNMAVGAEARRVIINGASFDVGRTVAVFANDGLNWNLVNAS